MAIQLVNVGAAPNDGTGDPLRVAFIKINGNFTEVQVALTDINVSVGDIEADLALKADDATVVHRTGNLDEDIDGVKTFLDDIFMPNIVTDPTPTVAHVGIGTLSRRLVQLPPDENIEIIVTNKSGAMIPKGSVVYVDGAQGNKPTVALALADPNTDTSFAIGIVENDILNNAVDGQIVTSGVIERINTSAFNEGDKVYLSPTTPGGLVNVVPTSPDNVIFIGTVISSHASLGKILVSIGLTFKIDRLIDVSIAAPTDSQVLSYEASTGLWKNKDAADTVVPIFTPTINGLVPAPGTPTGRVLSDNATWIVPAVTGIQTIVPGTNIAVNNADPQNPIVSAIPATSAGVFDRVYFTGQVASVATPIGPNYDSIRNGKGSVALVGLVTSGLNASTKVYIPNDIIGPAQVVAGTLPIGNYTGFLSVQASSAVGLKRFTIEVFLCDNAGAIISSSGPVSGSTDPFYAGKNTVTILDSGDINLANDDVTQIGLSGYLANPIPAAVGQRFRFHISVARGADGGGAQTMTVNIGNTANSYIEAPVPINTTTVINLSSVPGATATDALNALASLQTNIAASVINWNFSHQYKTLSANTTFTFSNAADAKTIIIAVTNTVGNFTVTWPAGVLWTGGIEPTQTIGAKTDIYTLVQINGIIYGSYVYNFS